MQRLVSSSPDHPASRGSGAEVYTTGLGWPALAAIFGVTVAVFLVYGGPLWGAGAGASHLGRILVSYLVAVPLVVVAQLWRGSYTPARAVTATAVIWGAKLLVTASAYAFIAPGAARTYETSRPWSEAGAPRGAAPPPAGAVGLTYAPVRVRIGPGGFQATSLSVRSGARLSIENHTSTLHAIVLEADGRRLWNVPLPPAGAPREVEVPEPGTYRLSCVTHPEERLRLEVAPATPQEIPSP